MLEILITFSRAERQEECFEFIRNCCSERKDTPETIRIVIKAVFTLSVDFGVLLAFFNIFLLFKFAVATWSMNTSNS